MLTAKRILILLAASVFVMWATVIQKFTSHGKNNWMITSHHGIWRTGAEPADTVCHVTHTAPAAITQLRLFTSSGSEATESMKLAKRFYRPYSNGVFKIHIMAAMQGSLSDMGMNTGAMHSGPCCRVLCSCGIILLKTRKISPRIVPV